MAVESRLAGSEWRRAAVELDTRVVRLFGRCNSCLNGFDITEWQLSFGSGSVRQLMGESFPRHLHLLPVYARDISSNEVVVRPQDLRDRQEQAVYPAVFSFNCSSGMAMLQDLRETSLSAVHEYGSRVLRAKVFRFHTRVRPKPCSLASRRRLSPC
jgi:hypothetical protein